MTQPHTTPQETTITLRTYGVAGDTMPPHSLSDTIAMLQECLLEIPSEYRASAEVDVSPYWEHGETYDQMRITYSRLETQDEADARGRQERETMLKWIEQEEALIRRRKAELGI